MSFSHLERSPKKRRLGYSCAGLSFKESVGKNYWTGRHELNSWPPSSWYCWPRGCWHELTRRNADDERNSCRRLWCRECMRNIGEYKEDDNAERDRRCHISNWSSLLLMGRWEEPLETGENVVWGWIVCQWSSYKRWRLRYVIIATTTNGDETDSVENRENTVDADVGNQRRIE